MKNTVLFTLLSLLLTQHSFSQNTSKQYKWPGFVQLNDSVFIGRTEISIIDYEEIFYLMKEFLGPGYYVKDAFPSPYDINWIEYNPYLKETFTIGQLYSILDSSYKNHSKNQRIRTDTIVSHLSYISNRPVVNITREQALLYCKLRTSAFPTLKENVSKDKGWALPDSVYFRLPNEEEWMLASNEYIETKEAKKRSKKPAPVLSKEYFDSLKTGESMPQSVYYGYVNKKSLVNLCGNVAEMIMDSDYVFGGSYLDSTSGYSPLFKSSIKPPQQNIGFRIVAVIRRKESN